MNHLRVELIPALGFRIADLGVSALVGGAHGLKRLAEDLVWGRPQGHPRQGAQGCCSRTHHHYRVECQPRCYDCNC